MWIIMKINDQYNVIFVWLHNYVRLVSVICVGYTQTIIPCLTFLNRLRLGIMRKKAIFTNRHDVLNMLKNPRLLGILTVVFFVIRSSLFLKLNCLKIDKTVSANKVFMFSFHEVFPTYLFILWPIVFSLLITCRVSKHTAVYLFCFGSPLSLDEYFSTSRFALNARIIGHSFT